MVLKPRIFRERRHILKFGTYVRVLVKCCLYQGTQPVKAFAEVSNRITTIRFRH
jgi:hypothetical protein